MEPFVPRSSPRQPVSTLVVGLGNPVLGDDAVGWRVAEALRDRLASEEAGALRGDGVGAPAWPPVEIDCLSLGGLRLMERLVGYERAIVVDAIVTGSEPGTLAWSELDVASAPSPSHTGSAHDTTLATALQLGRSLGACLPSEVHVLGVEAGPCFEFGEVLSPRVEAAVPRAVDMLLARLRPAAVHGSARNNGRIGTGRAPGPATKSGQ